MNQLFILISITAYLRLRPPRRRGSRVLRYQCSPNMSHKSVKVRSSLSFNGPDGILDMDHIINSDPWKSIEQFDKSEVGSIQNVLNEFSDKIRIDKKARTPETTKIDRAVADSQGGVPNKSRIRRMQSMPMDASKEGPKLTKSGNKRLKTTNEGTKEAKNKFSKKEETETVAKQEPKRRSNRSERIVNRDSGAVKGAQKSGKDENKLKVEDERPRIPSSRLKPKAEGKKVASKSQECRTKENNSKESAKSPTRIDRRKIRHSTCLEDASNMTKKTSMSRVSKQLSKQTEPRAAAKNQATKTTIEKRIKDVSMDRHSNPDFHTSTPEEKLQQRKVSIAKRLAEEKKARSDLIKRKSIGSSNVPFESVATAICPKKEPSEDISSANIPQSEVQADKNNNTPDRLTEKPCPIKNIEKPTTEVAENKIQLPKLYDNASRLDNPRKNSTRRRRTEITGKEIGKYEKRLLEKEENAKTRRMQRHEKRAAKAMEKFSYHVVKIARDMGYFPGDDVSSDTDDCCSSLSAESSSASYTDCSYSCSCSGTSCSCTYPSSRGSDDFSEFTLCSCSGCDLSSFTDTSQSEDERVQSKLCRFCVYPDDRPDSRKLRENRDTFAPLLSSHGTERSALKPSSSPSRHSRTVENCFLRDTDRSSLIVMKLHEKKESGIHKVQEVPLEELDLSKEYDIEKTLGEGSFAKVLLATHRATQTRVVLKAVHQELTTEKDFFREFHYSYRLSPHPNILCSYAVAFKAEKCFVFAQEYAAYGDLAGNVKAGGLSEEACKRIAGQLASALDFIHSKQLAHRDIKLENVLVFAPDMSKIKLCDFGCTRREGTLVNKIRCTWVSFQPPEIYEVIKNERYACKRSADCWQFGIVLFVCLTGNPPWQSADLIQDPDYSAFQRWLKRRTAKIPPSFRRFAPRLLRYFRRAFEHKPEKRPHVTEINKYLKDSWCIGKISHSATSTSIDVSDSIARRGDSLLYLDTILDDRDHMDENKNKLRKLLNSYGLETTVDQKVVTKRIWEWVMQCDSNVEEPNLIGVYGTDDILDDLDAVTRFAVLPSKKQSDSKEAPLKSSC
ncbi:hypothetical protein KM043_011502 [Ampulex compressa]|nr:hypothetical protein KM043_011502 [Ampulex compressa]